jgi:hypothetical protein
MAINVLRGRFRLAQPEPNPEALAIGEQDREIFNCPVCSRPLAVGSSRCPGCHTRLVMGVPMRRVSVFVALGTTGAVAVVLSVITLLSVTQAFTARAGGESATPTPAPASTSRPLPGGGPLRVPPNVRAALDQAASTNQRLAAISPGLRSALERGDLDSPAVAAMLRDLAVEATRGADLLGRLSKWSAADPVAVELDSLYRDVRAVARTGLAASVTNDRAYRIAAQRMVNVLRRAAPVNHTIEAVALSYGLELPSLPRTIDASPMPVESSASPAQPA